MNPKTVVYYFHRLREIIAYHFEQDADTVSSGVIKVDENDSGGKRKEKRGQGAVGKVRVFSFLKRGDKVYMKVIDDTSSVTLCPIIECKVVPDSIVYSDCWRSYNMSYVSEFKDFRNNGYNLKMCML